MEWLQGEIVTTSNFLVLASLALAALGIPLILKLVPPNAIYGFGMPRTAADRTLWFRVNRFAGWAMLAAGGVSASIYFFAPEVTLGSAALGIGVFVIPLLIALAATGAYVRKSNDG